VRGSWPLLAAALLSGVLLACGRVPGSGASPTPSPGQPNSAGQQPAPLASSQPPPTARQAVSVQLKVGADPNAVGARVLGPNAFVRPAWRGAANPPVGPAARRTYVIPVPPEQEQAALGRARADSDVERAQLVPWPPDFP
jgi:hypothetical protein